MGGHVRVGGNDLLLRGQVRALLELEISQGARQGQVTIDSAKVNKSTRCADARFLAYLYVSN